MSLYKFMKREYALSLVHSGTVRIGTLYDFRNIEDHASGIGDKGEGTRETRGAIHFADSDQPNFPDFLRRFAKVDTGGRFTAHDSLFVERQESPDFYVFCCSEEYNPDIWLERGYDGCVEIKQPDIFFRALTKSLYAKGRIKPGCYVERCVYIDRSQDYRWEHPAHPAVMKPPSFAHEKEMRAIWTPRDNQISPFILYCRTARKFCRLMPPLSRSTSKT